MNDNMQDILKNYYASGGKILFESAEQLAEAPIISKPEFADSGTVYDMIKKTEDQNAVLGTAVMIGTVAGVIGGANAGVEWIDAEVLTNIAGGVQYGGAGAIGTSIVGATLQGIKNKLTFKGTRERRLVKSEVQAAKDFLDNNPDVLIKVGAWIDKTADNLPDGIKHYVAELNELIYNQNEFDSKANINTDIRNMNTPDIDYETGEEIIKDKVTNITRSIGNLVTKYLLSKQSEWEELANSYDISGDRLSTIFDIINFLKTNNGSKMQFDDLHGIAVDGIPSNGWVEQRFIKRIKDNLIK